MTRVLLPVKPGESLEDARRRLEREDPAARDEATQEVLRQLAAMADQARRLTKRTERGA